MTAKATSAFDIVCAARMAVYKRLPYFMKMLFKLAPVERPGAGTFFVDEKLRVHYDPALALKYGVEFCGTFLAHEVQHPLRQHLARGKAFVERESARWHSLRPWLAEVHPMLGVSVPFFWNVVADLEVNPSVIEAGFEFPKDFQPLFPKHFKLKGGDFAESYAEELFARAEKLRQQSRQQPQKEGGDEGSKSAQPGAGDGGSKGRDGDDAAERPADGGDDGGSAPDSDTQAAPGDGTPPRSGDANGEKDARPFEGSCGSCAGHRHSLEDSADESAMPHGVSDAEVDIARRQVAHDTLEPSDEMKRLMSQYGKGTVPGSFEQWAKAELAPPEVRWQDVLAPLVRNAVAYVRGRMEWTHRRPSRRQSYINESFGDDAPLLPSMASPVPNVAIVVDTSGSMQSRGASGRAMLEEALSEVVGIVLATGAPCWTVAVDAAVQKWVRVRNAGDVQKLVVGGGGTDMRVGIKAAEERKSDIIVLVTDGYTDWPTRSQMPKRARLVVCTTTGEAVPAHITPVVRIEPKAKKEEGHAGTRKQ